MVTQIQVLINKKEELEIERKKTKELTKKINKIIDSFLPFFKNTLKLELIEIVHSIHKYIQQIDQEIEKIDQMILNLERRNDD